jgi:hypothetical protein
MARALNRFCRMPQRSITPPGNVALSKPRFALEVQSPGSFRREKELEGPEANLRQSFSPTEAHHANTRSPAHALRPLLKTQAMISDKVPE